MGEEDRDRGIVGDFSYQEEAKEGIITKRDVFLSFLLSCLPACLLVRSLGVEISENRIIEEGDDTNQLKPLNQAQRGRKSINQSISQSITLYSIYSAMYNTICPAVVASASV